MLPQPVPYGADLATTARALATAINDASDIYRAIQIGNDVNLQRYDGGAVGTVSVNTTGITNTVSQSRIQLSDALPAMSVSAITVNGVAITSSAMPFDTTLEKTAQAIAANINASSSSPNYSARAEGRKVIIISEAAEVPADGFPVGATVSGLVADNVKITNGVTLDNKIFVQGSFSLRNVSRIPQLNRRD